MCVLFCCLLKIDSVSSGVTFWKKKRSQPSAATDTERAEHSREQRATQRKQENKRKKVKSEMSNVGV
jgi:hypothetical protein